MTSEKSRESSEHAAESDGLHQGNPRLRLEFHSDDIAKPFRDQFEEDVTITVDSIVQLSDRTHLQYWTVTGGTAAKLIETVTTFPTTKDVRLLSSVGTTHRFEVHGSSRSLFAALNEFGGNTKSAVYGEGGVYVVADFPPDVNTDDVETAVDEIFSDLTIVSLQEIRTTNVLRPLIQDQLTDRQRTALQVAYFGGYYEQPRRSTGGDLADRMGISKQAFHEHLRKAYATIFSELLENTERNTEVDS